MRIGSEKEIRGRLEAALYSAGRPLSLEELQQASDCGKEKTIKILKQMIKDIETTFTSLELKQLDDKSFVLQIKHEYLFIVRRFAQQPILSNSVLKTLSYITYEQPVTSKRLVEIRGSQVYSHLKELYQKGFIIYENIGRLKIYRTTKKFQEYFGIDDINKMKKKLIATTNKKL